jgi:hypothetical protein
MEAKGQHSNTRFVQDNISEAKDKYVPQELPKPAKTRNLREESFNAKPTSGVYDTTYGEYYKKKVYVRFLVIKILDCG